MVNITQPTIWIFSLEPIQTRYTAHWHTHIPKLLNNKLGDNFNIVQVDGIQNNTVLTPGAFLNFSDTNYWKSSQLCKWLDYYNDGKVSSEDQFIFTDAWNPTIIQLRYMSDLLGFNWTLHGLWHSGNYDKADFLGRLGRKSWISHTEKAFYYAIDHNYFATDFHVEMFMKELLNDGRVTENPWWDEDWEERYDSGKIVRTGWPMEYMIDTLAPYKNLSKRNLILFPHRIAPEKQVEIFRDLALSLPQYEFVVCQDSPLSKHEYHTLLGESKIVFSASNQETLGISPAEGAILDSVPLLPDRLSYSEMYAPEYLYPSEWSESYDLYIVHKQDIINKIIHTMENYDTYRTKLEKELVPHLLENYFTATNLIKKLSEI